MAGGEWLEIRCRSTACTTPGGRILYREKLGSGLISVKRRQRGIIIIGVPVLAVCDCGYVWRNRDLASVLDASDGLCEVG